MILVRTIIGTSIRSSQDAPAALLPSSNEMSLGSFSFPGVNGASLNYANDNLFMIGSGDFTVEWFSWISAAAPNPFPRIFSIGSYPSADIACSVEGGTFYIWFNSDVLYSFSVAHYNQWSHVAIVRESGVISVYYDGTRVFTDTNTANLSNGSSRLYIGMEESDPYTVFYGLITDFHFVKGAALYSGAAFEVSPISAVAETVLLARPTSPVGPTPINTDDLVTVFNNSPYDHI